MSLPTFLGSVGSLPDAVIWSDLAVPEDGDGGVVTRIYGFSGEKKTSVLFSRHHGTKLCTRVNLFRKPSDSSIMMAIDALVAIRSIHLIW